MEENAAFFWEEAAEVEAKIILGYFFEEERVEVFEERVFSELHVSLHILHLYFGNSPIVTEHVVFPWDRVAHQIFRSELSLDLFCEVKGAFSYC